MIVRSGHEEIRLREDLIARGGAVSPALSGRRTTVSDVALDMDPAR